MATLEINPANNGEVFLGATHQGRGADEKMIPWEALHRAKPRNDWSHRQLVVTKIVFHIKIKDMKNYNTLGAEERVGKLYIWICRWRRMFQRFFSQRKKLKIGWEVKPSFAVGQNYDRREVLDLMMEYFNCGFMRRDYADKTLKYEIRSLYELLEKVIPHFMKFPLKSSKQKDFLLFAEICEKNETKRTSRY